MTANTGLNKSLSDLLRAQKNVLSRAQALNHISESALRHRLRVGGPWTTVLPGIYLTNAGLPTVGQREMAAVLYCGPGSVITGPAALVRYGVHVPLPEIIDVLVPEPRKRRNAGFVRAHRTIQMPERIWMSDGLRYAPAARSVADMVRQLTELREVRAVVADAVQHGRCSIGELAAELASGPGRGSAGFRAALAEVADGVRSVAEGDLRALIKAAGLPAPLYNPSLYVGDQFLARPDAWWPDAGVACEVDSREWHLSPADWERTITRKSRMGMHGIIVVQVLPSHVRKGTREAITVVNGLRQAIESGRKRPRLGIRTVPAAR